MVIGNPALLEKYAREKYLMKKDNEDVFVIVKIPRKDSVEKKKRFYFFFEYFVSRTYGII